MLFVCFENILYTLWKKRWYWWKKYRIHTEECRRIQIFSHHSKCFMNAFSLLYLHIFFINTIPRYKWYHVVPSSSGTMLGSHEWARKPGFELRWGRNFSAEYFGFRGSLLLNKEKSIHEKTLSAAVSNTCRVPHKG